MKDEALNQRDTELQERQKLFESLESKEADLATKIQKLMSIEKDFFTNRVTQISSRYSSEMEVLEKILCKLLTFIISFKDDMDRCRMELISSNVSTNLNTMITKASEVNNLVNTTIKTLSEENLLIKDDDSKNNILDMTPSSPTSHNSQLPIVVSFFL